MAGPDLSVVTALVEFQTVVEAVLYVAAALAYLYVAKKGVKMIKAAILGDVGSSFNADDWVDDEDYWRIRKEQARIDIRSRFGRYF